MSLNIGSGISTARVSMGPAVIFVGAAGSTPTADVGLIGDDGAELEFQAEMGDLNAGNPMLTIMRYIKAQSVFLRVPSCEWSSNRLAYALGAGATSLSAGNEIFRFGGTPCPHEVALHLQHRKCTAAHTINVRIWKATTETGGLSVKFGADHHQFPFAWKGLRSTTNWAGGSLANTSELVEIDIELQ